MISKMEVEEKMNNSSKLKKIEKLYKYAIMVKVMPPLILDYLNKRGYAYGYEIIQYFRREFQTNYYSGTVYHTLYLLAGEGLVKIISDNDKRHDDRRRNWEITAKGKERLTLLERSPFLAKVIAALRA